MYRSVNRPYKQFICTDTLPSDSDPYEPPNVDTNHWATYVNTQNYRFSLRTIQKWIDAGAGGFVATVDYRSNKWVSIDTWDKQPEIKMWEWECSDGVRATETTVSLSRYMTDTIVDTVGWESDRTKTDIGWSRKYPREIMTLEPRHFGYNGMKDRPYLAVDSDSHPQSQDIARYVGWEGVGGMKNLLISTQNSDQWGTNYLGVWNSGVGYKEEDAVIYSDAGGDLYVCVSDVVGGSPYTPPTSDTDHWDTANFIHEDNIYLGYDWSEIPTPAQSEKDYIKRTIPMAKTIVGVARHEPDPDDYDPAPALEGTYWGVLSNPIGEFAGHAGELAFCDNNGDWTFNKVPENWSIPADWWHWGGSTSGPYTKDSGGNYWTGWFANVWMKKGGGWVQVKQQLFKFDGSDWVFLTSFNEQQSDYQQKLSPDIITRYGKSWDDWTKYYDSDGHEFFDTNVPSWATDNKWYGFMEDYNRISGGPRIGDALRVRLTDYIYPDNFNEIQFCLNQLVWTPKRGRFYSVETNRGNFSSDEQYVSDDIMQHNQPALSYRDYFKCNVPTTGPGAWWPLDWDYIWDWDNQVTTAGRSEVSWEAAKILCESDDEKFADYWADGDAYPLQVTYGGFSGSPTPDYRAYQATVRMWYFVNEIPTHINHEMQVWSKLDKYGSGIAGQVLYDGSTFESFSMTQFSDNYRLKYAKLYTEAANNNSWDISSTIGTDDTSILDGVWPGAPEEDETVGRSWEIIEAKAILNWAVSGGFTYY